LQEQKRNQRQSEPLGGRHKDADQTIEAAQEDRHVAIPLILPGMKESSDRKVITLEGGQLRCQRIKCDLVASTRDRKSANKAMPRNIFSVSYLK
jgi:hypothetical protein